MAGVDVDSPSVNNFLKYFNKFLQGKLFPLERRRKLGGKNKSGT